MSQHEQHVTPRREFIKNTVKIAAASALAGIAIPRVFAAEDNTIQLALIGCGGRGLYLEGLHPNLNYVALAEPDSLLSRVFRSCGRSMAAGARVHSRHVGPTFRLRRDRMTRRARVRSVPVTSCTSSSHSTVNVSGVIGVTWILTGIFEMPFFRSTLGSFSGRL